MLTLGKRNPKKIVLFKVNFSSVTFAVHVRKFLGGGGPHQTMRTLYLSTSRDRNCPRIVSQCASIDATSIAPYNETNQLFGRILLDLKSTINLPKTGFPMKANLPQNEPKMLERWGRCACTSALDRHEVAR